MARRSSTSAPSGGRSRKKKTRSTTRSKDRRGGEPASSPPRLFGAIDMGSNSIRLGVVEATGADTWRYLDKLTLPVRLGVDTFTDGSISSDSMRATCEVLNRFKEVLDSYRVSDYRAVATSAVREADNRDTFLDRVHQQTGINLEVLEAVEESSLTFDYLRQHLGKALGGKKSTLVADIGSGSVELMLIEDGRLVLSESQRTGTLRLLQLLHNASERRARQILQPFIQQSINTFGRVHLLEATPNLLVLSSLVQRGLVEYDGVARRGDLVQTDPQTFDGFAGSVLEMTADQRSRRFDLGSADAEELLPSVVLVESLLELTRAEALKVVEVTMLDCLILQMLTGGSDLVEGLEQQVRSATVSVGEKYRYDREHHQQVTRLALVVFDSLRDLHALGDRERLLLEVAGQLHDIGIFVSTRAHHKHSAYLIAASEIVGLSEDDLRIVSNVARYHRRALPKVAHLDYTTLPRDDRMVVSKLSAMLRIADALDRAHESRIRELRVEVTSRELVLWVKAPGELTIEEWALEQKADFFKSLYGLEVVLRRDD